MKWRQFVNDYLSFTRKERIGLLALVLITLIVFFLPKIIRNNRDDQYVSADTAWISAARRLEVKEPSNKEQKNFKPGPGDNDYAYQHDRSLNNSTAILFNFDPNTLDDKSWKKLGLKDNAIHTIRNYLNKGGHFYKTEDLKKIYGVHPNDYLRLEPYIKIGTGNPNSKPVEYVKQENKPTHVSYNSIDINTADTSAFISLPGIGSKLAARIISFRDKLGGFYAVTQIAETYGLPDSTFQKIRQYLKPGNSVVKKINVNAATLDELRAHPYIRSGIANPIISYRNEHGPFSKLEDIKKVMAVNDEIYNKIAPYLTLQ